VAQLRELEVRNAGHGRMEEVTQKRFSGPWRGALVQQHGLSFTCGAYRHAKG
jgi:hypothetical protein